MQQAPYGPELYRRIATNNNGKIIEQPVRMAADTATGVAEYASNVQTNDSPTSVGEMDLRNEFLISPTGVGEIFK